MVAVVIERLMKGNFERKTREDTGQLMANNGNSYLLKYKPYYLLKHKSYSLS